MTLLCRAGFVSLPFISPSPPAKHFLISFLAHHRRRSRQGLTDLVPPQVGGHGRDVLLDGGGVENNPAE